MSLEVRPLPLAVPLADPYLFEELTRTYLVLDPFVDGERRVDLHPLVLSLHEHQAAAAVAERAVALLSGVAAHALSDLTEAERYRLPRGAQALAQASHESGDNARLVRVDLLRGHDGRWHVCEMNVDCPGGHNEAAGLPRLAQLAGSNHLWNPTNVVEATARRLLELAQGDTVGLMHATGYADDMQVCALLERTVRKLGGQARRCAPTTPQLVDGRLRLRGEPIGALYRFFPIEGMEGQANHAGLREALVSGHVRTLSSFSGAYAQSKTSLARAWCRRGELTPQEQQLLDHHIPFTVELSELPLDVVLGDREGWVLKRGFGRVGDEVYVGALHTSDEWFTIARGVETLGRQDEAWVAQRFVPQSPVQTPWGPRLVTLGVYVLEGRFCGYFARLTPRSHTSHDALCLPVLLEVAP